MIDLATLFGSSISKSQIMKSVGDVSQIADARESVLTSGRAEGMRAIDVKTGSGLNFTVLPSRAMDIAWAEFKGVPLAFISKSGVVSPAFFEKDGLSFLRSFTCGLLTTCGLTYMGAPCVDDGVELGLHGRVSNIPASDVSVYKEWEKDEFIIRIRGKVRQSAIFLENLCLTREISTKMGSSKITIKDTIENCGFEAQPFMILYHCNFGYPIVSENTVLCGSKSNVKARDAQAQSGIDNSNVFQRPTHDYNEQVFYHDHEKDKDGYSVSCLFNQKLSLGTYVKYNRTQFSHFGQWKLMGEGDYTVGLEPANWYVEGRAEARKRDELPLLQPGEIKLFEFEIGVVESQTDLQKI